MATMKRQKGSHKEVTTRVSSFRCFHVNEPSKKKKSAPRKPDVFHVKVPKTTHEKNTEKMSHEKKPKHVTRSCEPAMPLPRRLHASTSTENIRMQALIQVAENNRRKQGLRDNMTQKKVLFLSSPPGRSEVCKSFYRGLGI